MDELNDPFDESAESSGYPEDEEIASVEDSPLPAAPHPDLWRRTLHFLDQNSTYLLAFLVAVAVTWAARQRFSAETASAAPPPLVIAAPAVQASFAKPWESPASELPPFEAIYESIDGGILRKISLHTDIPTRPRVDVITYTVVKNDTLFGIAEKFGLQPETLLWGNFAVLRDSPHELRPDQVLNILPVNGTYHQWAEGQGLNGVAEFYGVTAQDIIDWPGNHLDPDIDPANPNIEPGTWLIVPEGRREFNGWPEIPQITRRATRTVLVDAGPGQCAGPFSGLVGSGGFIWPTTSHRISGYVYSAYHGGVDLGAILGDPIFAADAGVVVYAGWNNWGYGNLVVIDHGNGWQTVYAHLNTWNVVCGQSVTQGAVLGGAGTTGRSSGVHLHFEMRSEVYGRVNPLNFLP